MGLLAEWNSHKVETLTVFTDQLFLTTDLQVKKLLQSKKNFFETQKNFFLKKKVYFKI
jgi:hypothetical protein